MTDYKKILEPVKNDIRPDASILADVDLMVTDINESIKKSAIKAECVAGGSIAKGTFLKDDYDIDLFIRFNLSYNKENISDVSERILKQVCKKHKTVLERIHGSRDYFQFKIKNGRKTLDFEIIPVLKVHTTAEAVNVTDLSPEHVAWVKRYAEKDPKILDDIRLAKQFCKSAGVYGAESYINGFSGHIIDILIIYYGSFMNLLKEFSRKKPDIKRPIIIDPEHKLKNPLEELNRSKISPLIIIDPVQDDRNSAAALSQEKLTKFIDACNAFLKKPSKTFFVIKKFILEDEIKVSLSKIRNNNVAVSKVYIKTMDGSKDVVGTKCLKAYESIITQLSLHEFHVLASGWNFNFENRTAEAYIITDKNISEAFVQQGPMLSMKSDYDRFMKKHSRHKTDIKGNRVYATMPRRFTDVKIFLKDLSKKDFIKSRVKSIDIK